MSNESRETYGRGARETPGKSSGCDESGYSEVMDFLAVWVLEDIDAVARSCNAELPSILKDALDRVQCEAPLFVQRSMDAEG